MSVPTRFPLRYARANVLFGREGGRSALYKLGSVSYLFMSEAEKEAVLARLARFALAVRADFSLYRVTRAYPADRYAEQAGPLLDTRYANATEWDDYLRGHTDRLRELRSTVPEVYLAVSLQPPKASRMGAGLMWQFDSARRRIEAMAGVETASPIAKGELQALAESEQRLFDRLSNIFPSSAPIERATTSQLQWLLRRAACRGIAEPELDGQWAPRAHRIVPSGDGEPSYQPLENTLYQTVNAPITESDRHLVVEAPEGDSHQAALAFGALPEDPEFPGPNAELLFAPLEAVDFPVDAVLHAHWQGNREALSRARKGVVDAENVWKEQIEGSSIGADYHSEENRALARELESYLKSDKRPPMLHARMSLVLGAETGKALEQRIDALGEHYGDVTLWQPQGLQQSLWFDHLPRTDGGLVDDYSEPLTIDQFGALLPTGTHLAGSTRGLYIGYTPRGRRPIKYAPEEAAQEKRLTGVLMAGTPGSGKALADTTPIPTPEGWRSMADLQAGDQVFDDQGNPCNVLGVYPQPPDRECYEIVFSDGSTIVADADHRWLTVDLAAREARAYRTRSRKRSLDHLGGSSRHRGVASHSGGWIAQYSGKYLGFYQDEESAAAAAAEFRRNLPPRRGEARARPQVRTTAEIRDTLHRWGKTNHAVQVTEPLRYPPRDLPLDPYVLGAWLGDGSSACAVIHTGDPEIATEIAKAGYEVTRQPSNDYGYSIQLPMPHAEREKPCARCGTTFVAKSVGAGYCSRSCAGSHTKAGGEQPPLERCVHCGGELGRGKRWLVCNTCRATRTPLALLRNLGVLHNKHVPEAYLTASIEQRLALLQGLLDTDGTISAAGEIEFCSTNPGLAVAVRELLLGLGMKATLSEGRATLAGKLIGPKYRVQSTPHLPVFRLQRKAARLKPRPPRSRRALRYITDVRPVDSVPVRCIAVDSPSHLYLAGDECIPTHNTNAAELLGYQAARAGHLVVDVDPKPDHNFEALPDMKGQVDVIDISSEERYRGMLDPLRVAIPSMREEVATSYMVQALHDPPPAQEQAVQRAVRDEVQAGGTSSLKIIERLHQMGKHESHPATAEAAELAAQGLELVADSGLGRLAFGTGGDDDLAVAAPITTIRMPNVELPEPEVDRRDYDRNERIAVAALTLVNSFALRLIADDRSRHKVVIFDEAWFLLASSQGKRLLNRLVREGRARNATVVIATQRLADLGELQNLIGTYFMFGQETDAEARQALEILGLDPEDRSLVQTVRAPNYRQGLCLMRDIDGRVAEVQIDLVYQELLDAFDTTPDRAGSTPDPAPVEAK